MRRRVRVRLLLGAGAVVLVTSLASACSPIYVIRAGIAEAKILRARRPIPEVILDPTTDERTKTKLTFVMEARNYAIDVFGLDVGRSYTSFSQLESDTLALVLSAAHRDQLTPKTWWFPIVGTVPYKGYFDEDNAIEEQEKLEEDGFDTFLRPTAAFSTLGWFADPLLSTLLRLDEVDLVETVLHELSHNHLFVKGQVRFNESFATFVGRAGAIEFFCNRQGGGADTVKCLRAQARWRDHQRFEAFTEGLVEELQVVYQDSTSGVPTPPIHSWTATRSPWSCRRPTGTSSLRRRGGFRSWGASHTRGTSMKTRPSRNSRSSKTMASILFCGPPRRSVRSGGSRIRFYPPSCGSMRSIWSRPCFTSCPTTTSS